MSGKTFREFVEELTDEEKFDLIQVLWNKSFNEDWFANEIYDPYVTQRGISNIDYEQATEDYDSFDAELDAMDATFIAETTETSEKIAEIVTHQENTVKLSDESLKDLESRISANTKSMLEDITQQLNKNKYTSKLKGNDAEDIIELALSERWEYERTSDKAHEGDFVVKLEIDRTYKILIDVKNYKGVIPTKEYSKFVRDILSTNSDGGIYFAYSGSIPGQNKCIKLENISANNIPVVLVQDSPDNSINFALDLLKSHIILRQNSKNMEGDLEKLKVNTDQAIIQVNSLAIIKNNLQECANFMSQTLNKAQIDLEVAIISLRSSLENISGSIRHGASEWVKTDIKGAIETTNKSIPKLNVSIKKEITEIIQSICSKLETLQGKLEVKSSKSIININNITLKINSREQVVMIPSGQCKSLNKIFELIPNVKDANYIDGFLVYALRYRSVSDIEVYR
jgi:hypothetical protein